MWSFKDADGAAPGSYLPWADRRPIQYTTHGDPACQGYPAALLCFIVLKIIPLGLTRVISSGCYKPSAAAVISAYLVNPGFTTLFDFILFTYTFSFSAILSRQGKGIKGL